MKHVLRVLLIIVAVGLSSCDKDVLSNTDLEGSWELRHVKGIQIAGMSPDFPAGNGHIVRFVGNTYELTSKGSVPLISSFVLLRDTLEIDGEKFYYRLDLDRPNGMDLYVKVSGKKLLISYGSIASDGSTSTYVRL